MHATLIWLKPLISIRNSKLMKSFNACILTWQQPRWTSRAFHSDRVLKLLYLELFCTLDGSETGVISWWLASFPTHSHSSPRRIVLSFYCFWNLIGNLIPSHKGVTLQGTERRRKTKLVRWEGIQEAYIIKQDEADMSKIHDRPSFIDCGGQLRGRC